MGLAVVPGNVDGDGTLNVTESDRCLDPGRARRQGKLEKEKEEEGYHRV